MVSSNKYNFSNINKCTVNQSKCLNLGIVKWKHTPATNKLNNSKIVKPQYPIAWSIIKHTKLWKEVTKNHDHIDDHRLFKACLQRLPWQETRNGCQHDANQLNHAIN